MSLFFPPFSHKPTADPAGCGLNFCEGYENFCEPAPVLLPVLADKICSCAILLPVSFIFCKQSLREAAASPESGLCSLFKASGNKFDPDTYQIIMQNYTFHSLLLERRPTYDHDFFKQEKLEELLSERLFLTAIRLASTSLYHELEKAGFRFHDLPAAARLSLIRYLNRMCFRPVPFGLFASFACASWRSREKECLCDLQDPECLHLLPDSRMLNAQASQIAKEYRENLKYYPNNSLYRAGTNWRYLSINLSGSYEVRSLNAAFPLKSLFKFCSKGKSHEDIAGFLEKRDYTRTEALDCLEILISLSLLLPEIRPECDARSFVQKLRPFYPGLPDMQSIRFKSGNDFPAKEMFTFPAGQEQGEQSYYGAFERRGGALSESWQDCIKEGMKALMALTGTVQVPSFERFKQEFRKRYDREEVPLLLALDPVLGIGYGLEEAFCSNSLLDKLNFNPAGKPASTSWTTENKRLLQLLCAARSGEAIQLSEEDLGNVNTQLPSSLSVVFRVSEDKVLIEAAGPGALAIPGRFCLFSDDLYAQAKQLAAGEQRCNPDVLFAEVTFKKGDKTDNINSRPSFYDYEVPLLLQPSLKPENCIALSDLYITMSGDELVLFSRRLKKRVIPRMSTAYNYQISDLSVLHFLGDLQFPGCNPAFHISLEALFPGLHYYPRLEYRNCILAPAFWILNEAQLKRLSVAEDRTISFVRLAAELQLPRCFYIGHSDRQLLIDSSDPFSMELFFRSISGRKTLKITEAFPGAASGADAVIPRQYVASLLKNSASYQQFRPGISSLNVQRNFLPGVEWLCFKIYCNEAVADVILKRYLAPLIKLMLKKKAILSWFFVRYTDTGPHIRLRLRLASTQLAGELITRLNQKLSALYEQGTVRDIHLVPYQRELERYGGEAIAEAEASFRASADLVIAHLGPGLETGRQIRFACRSVLEAAKVFLEKDELESFFHESFSSLYREFSKGKELRLAMDRVYRELAPFLRQLSTEAPEPAFKTWLASLEIYRQKASSHPSFSRHHACADLIHMHLNRLFSKDQRQNEMMVYFMLWKGRKILM